MNWTNAWILLIFGIYALLITAEGDKIVRRGKKNSRRDTGLKKMASIFATKSDKDLSLSSPKLVTHSNKRKSHSKSGKKLRTGRLKKFKQRSNLMKKAKLQKNADKKDSKIVSMKNVREKTPKGLGFKRSKIQSRTISSLAKYSKPRNKMCGKCISHACPSVEAMREYCPSGVVADECSCCVQCASGIGMTCHLSSTSDKWLPPCGKDLKCVPTINGPGNQPTQRDWGSSISLEGICSCVQKSAVCASNDVTYENVCEYREAAIRRLIITDQNISIGHDGPCRSAPKINSKPADVSAMESDVVSFRCETSGFPIPRVYWIKKGGDSDSGKDLELPGYLNHAVTQIRGGPRKYQMTTWLTLDHVTESDSGIYICRSSNSYGIEDAAASLRIVTVQ